LNKVPLVRLKEGVVFLHCFYSPFSTFEKILG
jgi:hypothetical protein